MSAYLLGLQYFLPETIRSNEDLVALNPGWNAEKIFRNTGIRQRRIAGPNETASDLGYVAAERLLAELDFDRNRIDALLFCTQSPDFFLPTTACLLQHRLKLPTSCGAFDFNLGSSGFTYGLWLARSLILSRAAAHVLLVVGDTYSKYLDSHDLATVAIFGDGAAAALIGPSPEKAIAQVGETVVGTDGSGAQHLMVANGCARFPRGTHAPAAHAETDTRRTEGDCLSMNGIEIFSFTLSTVQRGIAQLLERTSLRWDDVDLFLFHQANRFILEQLRRGMAIPEEKLPIDLEDCGNTVGASIPILVRRCRDAGLVKPGQRCVLAGFGGGYSWAMTDLAWGA